MGRPPQADAQAYRWLMNRFALFFEVHVGPAVGQPVVHFLFLQRNCPEATAGEARRLGCYSFFIPDWLAATLV